MDKKQMIAAELDGRSVREIERKISVGHCRFHSNTLHVLIRVRTCGLE